MGDATNQIVADEWLSFPGGELEGKRPKELCADCRDRANRPAGASPSGSRLRTLCFQCYRAELDRGRALAAAGPDTTAVNGFQAALPFEPVNKPRLAMLKVERATAREAMRQGMGRFADRRRQAQIAARRALHVIVAGVNARRASCTAQPAPGAQPVEGDKGGEERQESQGSQWSTTSSAARELNIIMSAIRAAELQLPESWLPFVVSR
jgi:hypothetical protein